jgi:hypothetical protein
MDLLLTKQGYFVPTQLGVDGIAFYCVCGPYRSCDTESATHARRLGYSRPEHNFTIGLSRLRQKVMIFTRNGLVDVELPYGPHFIALEHESYCEDDLGKRISLRR